jgi:hypothetical protein
MIFPILAVLGWLCCLGYLIAQLGKEPKKEIPHVDHLSFFMEFMYRFSDGPYNWDDPKIVKDARKIMMELDKGKDINIEEELFNYHSQVIFEGNIKGKEEWLRAVIKKYIKDEINRKV